MRIAIDLQGAQSGSRHRGIGRYTLSLAQAMVVNGSDHEFIVTLNGLFPETIEPVRALFEHLIPQENIRVWTAAGPVHAMDSANNWRRHAAQLEREAFLSSLDADIVHITSLFEGFDDNAVHSIGTMPCRHGTAITFYDVIPLLQSDLYLTPHPIFEPLYREKIAQLRKADIYLAISESSRQEAIEYVGVSPDQIVSIAAAVDAHFHPLPIALSTETTIRDRFGLSKPFIMYSGATDERKNHLRLIKAFSMLPHRIRNRFQLAIVGRLPGTHHEAFKKQILACGLTTHDVVITGGVTDLELHQLYNLCHLFIFPSWHEGFGLPALEAMACGAAVIGSNTTSLPEVIGRLDALFDPFSEKAIAEKMSEALTNDTFRDDLKRHGPIQAAKFSWQRSAKIALRKMEEWHAKRQSRLLPTTQESTAECSSQTLVDRITTLSYGEVSTHDWLKTAQAIAQNHPRVMKRQLFVDVSELAQRDSRGGIQRVVRAVLSELLANPPDGFVVAPVVSTPHVSGYRHAIKFTCRFLEIPESSSVEEPIEPHNGDVFLLGLDLDYNVIVQAEYLRSLRNLGVKIYFAIHDLIPVSMPWAYPEEWNMSNLHSRWLDVVQQHDGVICVSRSTADDFRRWIDAFGMKRIRPLKVGWFHHGADLSNSVPTRGMGTDGPSVLNALSKRITFLSVGTIEPRKGQMQALQAFNLLWAQGIDVNFVLVGKKGWGGKGWSADQVVQTLRSHPENGQRFFWLEAISDEYLELIYEESDCLLATSIGEGFGLPLIEAALHGVPIIARDISVFREVAADNAFYFVGSNADSVATAIQEWLALNATGSAPSSGGIPWQTWKQSTLALLDVILNDHWYYKWQSGEGMRFRTTDSRFDAGVGDLKEREIFSVGQQGLLVHGPSIPLEAGKYRITVRGRLFELGSGRAYIDVVMNGGKVILGEADIAEPDRLLNATLASLVVSVPEKCSDLEVRVWVATSTNVAVSVVDISPAEKAVDGMEFADAPQLPGKATARSL
jgi:glycosyltransferase involved in cell wall biosynthesis